MFIISFSRQMLKLVSAYYVLLCSHLFLSHIACAVEMVSLSSLKVSHLLKVVSVTSYAILPVSKRQTLVTPQVSGTALALNAVSENIYLIS
jgi:hypothetical protein